MRWALLLLTACTTAASPPPPPPPPPPPAPAPKVVAEDRTTNIHQADYVGPEACGGCHPDEHARWQQSLHRRMNQLASKDAIIGDFDDAKVPYAGGELRLTHDTGGYYMTTAKQARVTRYRITRTIGLHGLQEYVGVEDGRTEEVRLPFGWWPRLGRWVPQIYFDPWLGDETKFDAYAPQRDPWAERCPWCHSTYPFDQRIARSSNDHHRGHGLEQFFISAPQSDRLAVEQQVTPGISCESCHLGGKAHAAGVPITFVPRGAVARPDAPVRRPFAQERRDASVTNKVCEQCHSGPSPKLENGTSLRNSAEAHDLAASKCKGLACIDCHDPHKGGSDEARAIATCTSCHADKQQNHFAHKTATCLDCHMPKVTMGLDHYVRTHRIASPTHLAINEPNACNLCHLDRTLAWTAEQLHQKPDPSWPELETGNVWLAGKRTYLRLITAFAYARSPLGSEAKLRPMLDDPYAYVRAWTKFAIEDLVHHKIDVPHLVH